MADSFRPFLVPVFDRDSLARLGSSLAVIDAVGTILWVNPAWDRFAIENGAEGGRFVQRSYFDAIARPLRSFFEAVFTNALATGQVFEHEYECSSPDTRRIFFLRALPIAGRALVLDHGVLVESPHEEGVFEPSETDYWDGETGCILQCSNCRRVRRADGQAWDWVRVWVARSHPKTSHGLCPTCVGFYWGQPRKRTERDR